MSLLHCRNGIYEVRVQIPKDVQPAWGKTAETRSLGTRDENQALEMAGPIIAAIKRRIAAMRAGTLTPATVPAKAEAQPVAVWSPDDAFAAIQRWAKEKTDRAYLQHFHGEAPAFDRFGEEGVAHSAVMHALQERRWADIDGFDDALVDAISGEGVQITRGHPAIARLRAWFGEAREAIEKEIERFRREDFSRWSMEAPTEPLARPEAAPAASGAQASPSSTLPISGLLDKFIDSERPAAKDESEVRGYVRRLFDLRQRPLRGYRRVKNAQSKRAVPIHEKLIELGLTRYARQQDEWLFPDLPHNADDDGAATRKISKWFGHWRRANGLYDPARIQDFHSLRHSFKDACREAKLAEDVHDRLTGHAGTSNQQTSRGYGKGGSLTLLAESMNSVAYA